MTLKDSNIVTEEREYVVQPYMIRGFNFPGKIIITKTRRVPIGTKVKLEKNEVIIEQSWNNDFMEVVTKKYDEMTMKETKRVAKAQAIAEAKEQKREERYENIMLNRVRKRIGIKIIPSYNGLNYRRGEWVLHQECSENDILAAIELLELDEIVIFNSENGIANLSFESKKYKGAFCQWRNITDEINTKSKKKFTIWLTNIVNECSGKYYSTAEMMGRIGIL